MSNLKHPIDDNDILNVILKKGLPSLITAFLDKYFSDHEGELPSNGLYHRIMDTVERPLIESTLKLLDYNQKKTSEVLGINRNTLRKKIVELGIVMPSPQDNKLLLEDVEDTN